MTWFSNFTFFSFRWKTLLFIVKTWWMLKHQFDISWKVNHANFTQNIECEWLKVREKGGDTLVNNIPIMIMFFFSYTRPRIGEYAEAPSVMWYSIIIIIRSGKVRKFRRTIWKESCHHALPNSEMNSDGPSA